MENETLLELKRMNKLLVLMITKGMNQNESIETLAKAGFQMREIADLTGVKSTIVNATMYKQKNKKNKK